MSIRLSKVTKECNVGLQTVVEFLQKKGFGDVEASPNSKISEEQYELLLKEFSPDKGLRTQAEKLSQQRQENKESKKASSRSAKQQKKPEMIKVEVKKVDGPKVLGHIDLDAAKKPKEKPAQETAKQEAVAATPETVKEQTVQKSETATAETTAPKAEKPAIGTEVDGVFRLNPAPQAGPGLTVKGHIDLSALNQSTRPKKKSKEEKRREREEKNRPNGQQGQGDRKKRTRIGKERVDVNAVANQIQNNNGNGGGQKKNNNANNNHANANNNGGKNKQRQKNQPKQAPVQAEVSDEEVAKQVRETLARLTNKNNKMGKGAKYRREKRDAIRAGIEEEIQAEAAESKILKLTEFVTANELATMMNVPVTQVIATCMSIGIMVSINQRMDAETINIVAEEFGFQTEYVSTEVSEAVNVVEDDEEDLLPRAPIVTVMGHVDHGKTSLLDYIRQTNVIAGEAGGITQHIGAYNVELQDGRHVTFLDTPGHEAFTAMRARGAQVTDIAIIIIAADDSIMPQTKEAINHAVAANVPIVFAINKVDKPTANPEKIKEGLAQMNFLVEDWGGKYQSQDISAKKGIGVEELLEKVLLEAEMLDLKANPNRKAMGTIIESSLDKGRGYVATVLVSNGTLRVGDVMLAGTHYGRVKAMLDERGRRVKEIGPAQAATILGLNGAPQAGDAFHIMDSDQEAREIASKREHLAREQGLRTLKRVDLNEIGRRIALGDFKELNLIVKGDVDGSIEALSDSLIKLSTEKIQVNVIQKAVGQISENDVNLAAASDAIIVAFQVRPSAAARRLAEQEGVDIRTYSVIYDAIEEVKDAMEGMLSPEIKEEVTAQVEVRQVYHISKVGTVAGAYVIDGKVHRSDKARVVRDGIVVFTGEINALKRFKDDVKEVSTNFECGLSLVNYNDLREGDIIETFAEIEIKAKL
ncbi:MAG: translation initiation factor IF-2 [Bacteroidaceae bacterium]|mgnify:CR=1 FL=1|nr:translation initiation factor IF-2 [Bacteroidaceae bacterium]MBO5785183.1 translation initiation factor IF-2 [Bacteroidaceae bacterium]